MFLWFIGLAWVSVWWVFRSPALDYRLVMLGAVLPVAEFPFGAGVAHTLLAPVAAMTVIMLATQGKRLLRRQLLGLPIGMFVHILLDGAWATTDLFWWPVTHGPLYVDSLPEFTRPLWGAVMELVGLAAMMWAIGAFGLDDAARRTKFLKTGQLDRTITGPDGAGASC